MADGTGISWTDATWNPIRGCTRVSEGCRNCYAEQQAARTNRQAAGAGRVGPYEGLVRIVGGAARWTGEVRMIDDHLLDPVRWKKPRRIFANSMSDLFHEKLTNEQIAVIYGVMSACKRHTLQCLTKRAARRREWFAWVAEQCAILDKDPVRFVRELALVHFAALELEYAGKDAKRSAAMRADRVALDRAFAENDATWPLANVWEGVSVENQEVAEERIPDLLKTPAAIRFLSCEPLLGPLELQHDMGGLSPFGGARIDWVIVGCESGPGARRCRVEWIRALRDQCKDAGVPIFIKQAREQIEHVMIPKGEGHYDTMPHAAVAMGDGSKKKHGGIIELPYIDGVKHAKFPSAAS